MTNFGSEKARTLFGSTPPWLVHMPQRLGREGTRHSKYLVCWSPGTIKNINMLHYIIWFFRHHINKQYSEKLIISDDSLILMNLIV